MSLYEGARTWARVDCELSDEFEGLKWGCTNDLAAIVFFRCARFCH